ncbi:TonB-dependent receptor [Sphingomonas sp. AP4-R1]|uniref:TonB-dependent receptor n=1 Tax=Sphingomonas sp. AP4-R1 TaxID=2735134 RepID=UPI00149377B5|nr:TonB-dependent receptor [Sphingomonas sp. AP4-R1]QJU58887.1 TonB-dependent receptor [Sphingomonas sp. AP4-R1]
MLNYLSLLAPALIAAAQGVNIGSAESVQAGFQAEPIHQPLEIVVTGDRSTQSTADVATKFDQDEISSQGTDSIGELLTRLSPYIDPEGREPIVLVNGVPIGLDKALLKFPPEALSEITVLKQGAGTQYSTSAGQRVVNLVLKAKFRRVDAEIAFNAATAGGQDGAGLSATYSAIKGDTRWSAEARSNHQGALLRSSRQFPQNPIPFGPTGYIVTPSGGEIDPSFSQMVGHAGLIAIPPEEAQAAYEISDFRESANPSLLRNPDMFRSLKPAASSAGLDLSAARRFGKVSATLSLGFSRDSDNSQLGVPMLSIIIPKGSMWSPFKSDIDLHRPLNSGEPLLARNLQTQKSISGSLSGRLYGVSASISSSFSTSKSTNRLQSQYVTEVDYASSALNDNINDNPYSSAFSSLIKSNYERALSSSFSLDVMARGNVSFISPLISWTVNNSLLDARTRQTEPNDDRAAYATAGAHRSMLATQLSIGAPVSRILGIADSVGDLSFNIKFGRRAISGQRPLWNSAYEIFWSPISAIQISASIERLASTPTIAQLNGQTTFVPQSVFDYTRQEPAEIIRASGGNPNLRGGSQLRRVVSASIQPEFLKLVTATASYRTSHLRDAIAPFPDLTQEIEQGFPERVSRDANGDLIAVDMRPINIYRDVSDEIGASVSFRSRRTPSSTRSSREKSESIGSPLNFGASFAYQATLASRFITKAGLPIVKRLKGGQGLPRQSIALQMNTGTPAFGVSLNGQWSSDAFIGVDANRLRVKPAMILGLSMFAYPDKLIGHLTNRSLAGHWKMTFSVQNLFDRYRQLLDKDGDSAPGYSRYEVDPVGRTVRLTIRKQF